MARVSKKVSERLEMAAEEVLQKIDSNNDDNTEKEVVKPKRHRRTKAEMQAAREAENATNDEEDNTVSNSNILKCKGKSHIVASVDWDIDKDDDTVLPRYVEIPDSILVGDYDSKTVSEYLTNLTGYCHKGFQLEWPTSYENFEEFCQWDIEKAHLKNLELPDFDFRNFYAKGDKVILIRYHEKLKSKSIYHLTLRTIYPRMLIGTEGKHCSQCIGVSERDSVFENQVEAMNYFNSIDAIVDEEYNEETGKKKRKHKKQEDDYDEEVDTSESNEEDDDE